MSPTRFASLALALALWPSVALADEVRFNRDIRPIMSDTCFHCHGPDAKAREADLRLDLRAEALKKTEDGIIPIVPGKPEESAIIERIFSTDKDEIMPPPKAHKELTAAQKETLKRWVAEGAKYEVHWAYAPLVKPEVGGRKSEVGNPIDAFIRARLAEKKIAPSPEAARGKLLRRVSLDLTGLPPTPAQVEAFEKDAAADAYEQQVARLLASPHYGERMAVWWLDVARFADTVGFHGDQNQRIFPYRDYVIAAFNENKPFDQFTIEQLAGDLLPNPTTEQLVATGYNRLNMMTREGGAQPKEYLAKYGAERVRSVAAAWFGSTFGCAECHDHKFDPIKSADFYSLQAFFADVKQFGVYGDYAYSRNPELAGWSNDHPFPPEIEVESPYLKAQEKRAQTAFDAHLATGRKRLASDTKTAAALEKWRTEAREFLTRHASGWMAPPVSVRLFKDGKAQPDTEVSIAEGLVIQFPKSAGKGEEYRINLQPGAERVAAVRVEVMEADPAIGPLQSGGQRAGMRLAFAVRDAKGKERKVAVRDADATAKQHRYKDGQEMLDVIAGWKLPAKADREAPAAVWLLGPPPQLAAGDRLVITVSGDTYVPMRVSVSPLAALAPLRVAEPAVREALLAEPRTPAQEQLVADTFLFSAPPYPAHYDHAKILAGQVREARGGRIWTLITQAVAEPLSVRLLPRGNWQDESGPLTPPATPSFLPGRIESTAEKRLTRLDLARWICSEENPITARTVMNRLWQMYFGTGLSAALDDLGSQGEPPSHPELLDWLASEFRTSGWDLKRMVTLMVTSATYRQSSSLRPELREIDPANRLLASQNPRRLEAEFVRDNALFIAGQLNLRDIGGPSARPYQPPGYYDALQFPDRDYEASTGAEQWRRGVYMHWQRTFLHPMLANFDAPSRDECTALRTVSNTPQQALTLLNDPAFVEAARVFAARLLATPNADDTARLTAAFELAVARPPREKEKDSLLDFLETQRDHYRATPEDAEKLLRVGTAPRAPGDPAELAAWTSLCRVVLNSQEVITRY